MATEILRPDTLEAITGTVRDFEGNVLDIGQLADESPDSGAEFESSGASIKFSMTNPVFTSFDIATFEYDIETLGGGTKGTVNVSFVDVGGNSTSIGSFQGAGSAQTISHDISTTDISVIEESFIEIEVNVANSKISEVRIVLIKLGPGFIKLTDGLVKLTNGKVTL